MGPHPYLCDCSKCDYERTLNRVREMQAKYRMQQEQAFLYGDVEDPFPPRTSTGRFEAKGPRYQQTPRPKFQGAFRRYNDTALDVINFQYKPWPGHEWVTYFTLTREAIVTAPNINFFGRQAVMNADKALQEKRFVKIERVY